ncbi:hypothetical protein [Desulforhopalus sp. 52FAK]
MKRITQITLLVISVVFLFGGPALAWKNKIVNNQFKVANYIVQLQNGANPDKISRPTLRRDKRSAANAANRELREAMDAAEELARAGKPELIKPPSFRRIVSEEKYQEMEKQIK